MLTTNQSKEIIIVMNNIDVIISIIIIYFFLLAGYSNWRYMICIEKIGQFIKEIFTTINLSPTLLNLFPM